MIALDPGVITAALASGLIVGALLGAFGGGGSVLATPLLIYLVGVPSPHVAIGTSAAAVAAIALASLIGHWRGGRVKWPCALAFAASGLTGSLIGSSVAKRIDGDVLLFGFALAMAAIGASMLRRRTGLENIDVRLTAPIAARIVPTGVAAGGAAGFFGVGGGFLIVPGLMASTGMGVSNAVASSLVSIAVFGASTATNYAVSGMIDIRLAGLLLVGGAAGAVGGLRIARWLQPRAATARQAFAIMILIVAGAVAIDAVLTLSTLSGSIR